MANFAIEGLEPALAKMKNLSREVSSKGVAKAAGKAMQIVKKDAVSRAKRFDDPKTAASIAENITISTKNKWRRGYVISKVGVAGGAARGKKLTFKATKKNKASGLAGQEYSVFHFRYLEFGTSQMRAQPFLRPALENNIGRVTESFVTSLNVEIDKAIG